MKNLALFGTSLKMKSKFVKTANFAMYAQTEGFLKELIRKNQIINLILTVITTPIKVPGIDRYKVI